MNNGRVTNNITSNESDDSISKDIELMSRIVEKDKIAFEKMIDTYMNDVFRFCYSIIKNEALAEEITQEVFLKLWRNAQSWKPTGRVKSWLLKITYNLTIDELRKNKDYTDIDSITYNLESYLPQPDDILQMRFLKDTIKDALLTLPERQRTAIMLTYYSGCSNKESAEIMNISVDAFESLLARGKGNLRGFLKEIKDKL